MDEVERLSDRIVDPGLDGGRRGRQFRDDGGTGGNRLGNAIRQNVPQRSTALARFRELMPADGDSGALYAQLHQPLFDGWAKVQGELGARLRHSLREGPRRGDSPEELSCPRAADLEIPLQPCPAYVAADYVPPQLLAKALGKVRSKRPGRFLVQFCQVPYFLP